MKFLVVLLASCFVFLLTYAFDGLRHEGMLLRVAIAGAFFLIAHRAFGK